MLHKKLCSEMYQQPCRLQGFFRNMLSKCNTPLTISGEVETRSHTFLSRAEGEVKWSYSCTHRERKWEVAVQHHSFLTAGYVVGGHRHASTSLANEEIALVPGDEEARWAPESVWMLRRITTLSNQTTPFRHIGQIIEVIIMFTLGLF